MSGVVVITGGTGFTGRYVARTFSNHGYAVLPLSSGSPTGSGTSQAGPGCDVTNRESIRQVLHGRSVAGVIHLAAESFVGEADLSRFYTINSIGTVNLLEVLREMRAEPSKIIIASSANVYGRNAGSLTDEAAPAGPVNHYAASKRAMELLVENWYEHFPVIVTRPFNYTGPGQNERFIIPKLVAHYRRREPFIELGNIDVERDFSDVEDVAECYLKLFESNERSQVFNICTGRAISIREILTRLCSICGYEIEVRKNPNLIRKAEIMHLSGSNKKLSAVTGFVPGFTDELLERMLSAN